VAEGAAAQGWAMAVVECTTSTLGSSRPPDLDRQLQAIPAAGVLLKHRMSEAVAPLLPCIQHRCIRRNPASRICAVSNMWSTESAPWLCRPWAPAQEPAAPTGFGIGV
jgi:hypothetical protein